MQMKKEKLISFVLVIFVFLSGMCFENVKTDSFYVYVSSDTTDACIMSCEAAIIDTEHCTTEMLGVRNGVGLQKLTGRFISQKRDGRLSQEFLYLDIFSLFEGKLFASSEKIHFLNQYQEEFVLNYIHKSDGKKRI